MIESARGFGLSGPRLVRKVILPSALPNILMALRICLALTMTALIVAEGIGTDKGIGYLVLLGKQYFRTDYMFLSIVLYAVLGVAFDVVIRIIERTAMPWRRHTTIRG
jgi:sulfonate transport system permease protein